MNSRQKGSAVNNREVPLDLQNVPFRVKDVPCIKAEYITRINGQLFCWHCHIKI